MAISSAEIYSIISYITLQPCRPQRSKILAREIALCEVNSFMPMTVSAYAATTASFLANPPSQWHSHAQLTALKARKLWRIGSKLGSPKGSISKPRDVFSFYSDLYTDLQSTGKKNSGTSTIWFLCSNRASMLRWYIWLKDTTRLVKTCLPAFQNGLYDHVPKRTHNNSSRRSTNHTGLSHYYSIPLPQHSTATYSLAVMHMLLFGNFTSTRHMQV